MADLVIERIFDAPVEKVWEAWTNPEMVKKWWGPKDFTCPVAEIDLKVGGKYLLAMRGPAGSEFDKNLYSTGTYKEIVPNKKLVITDSFSDSEGNPVSPTEYGMPESFPDELEITIEFEEMDGKTKMKLTHAGMPQGEVAEQTQAGWNESLDKLASSLS